MLQRPRNKREIKRKEQAERRNMCGNSARSKCDFYLIQIKKPLPLGEKNEIIP
jgi:hypothetical protein